MKEEWRPVKGYEGLYQVSNLGRVCSLNRVVQRNTFCGQVQQRHKGKILKPFCNNGGYEQCLLRKDGIVKTKRINRLVAEAFIPNPNNYPQVNHKDENKLNNKVENLEWCTAKYNVNYGTGIQRRSRKIRVDGIEYQSISEAEKSLGFPKSSLGWYINHNQTTYKNHKIELID